MPGRSPARVRRGAAGVILALFCAAVVGAAAAGWWYARESPAHQGPIVLISVDGLGAAALPAYGADRTDTPALETLAADAVVFDRAYAHSLQTLPTHASMLTGQLPVEHGVRDDAGFSLGPDVQTLAERLRSRGFATGAAVSSFLLRPHSGVAQGFTYFDAELPPQAPGATPSLERPGAQTLDAAERWIQRQDDQRFFVFVQVDRDDADSAVTRLTRLLKARAFYDPATIILVGDRGEPMARLALDDATLRVPLLVKQPAREGAGRRIAVQVQQIDLVPTILDLVRAPIPDDLRGRSLRPALDDDEAVLDATPVYAESVAPWYRLGAQPVFSLTTAAYRYIRGEAEELVAMAAPEAAPAGEAGEAGILRSELDRLLGNAPLHAPAPLAPRDEERYALFGYLPAPRLTMAAAETVRVPDPAALLEEHRDAALLIGQKNYSAGIRALQKIAREHPALAVVRFQVATLLVQTGRLDEAIEAFGQARALQPQSSHLAAALADALMRAGRVEEARQQADEAIALAGRGQELDRAIAHETAARVALALEDEEAAMAHAEAAEDADPTMPMRDFVRGRLLYARGEYEDAAAAFGEGVAASRDRAVPLRELHLYLGESLAHLDRYGDAEVQYRAELEAFPRNVQAYASLAMLYRASNRDDAVEDVLNELVSETPTPEGYAVAARLWTILGDRTRAEALRSDAQARFRGDPLPALLGRGGRR